MADITFGDRAIGDLASLIEASRGKNTAQGNVDYEVVPNGYSVVPLNFESLQDAPNRKRGTLVVRDVPSFIRYVNRHKDRGSLVLVDPKDGRTITAYLNHHEPVDVEEAEPGWGDHKVVLEPRWTPGWTAWQMYGDKAMTQEDFARFLDERLGEIEEPDGATLMEVATELRMNVDTEYERRTNLSNDTVQLVLRENMTTSIEIPTHFTIVLRPFDGAEAVRLPARLVVFKPDATGHVKFMWRLGEGPRIVLDEVFDKLADEIEAATVLEVLRGVWTP